MNEMDLYQKIIESCDEALRDAFIRRMEAAEPIAQAKIERQLEVYRPEYDRRSVERVCHGVSGELRPQMLALWNSLVRMNRGKQYAYFVKNIPGLELSYDKYITDRPEKGDILCTADIKDAVETTFAGKTSVRGSTAEVIEALARNESPFAVVRTASFYDTAWIYSEILDKPIFVNSFRYLADGGMLVLLSGRLLDVPENKIITAAFAISTDKPGDLVQQISVFTENGFKIEYLAVKTQNIEADDRSRRNIFFAELSGGGLKVEDSRAAFLQMEKECSFFRILGCRRSV